MTAVGVVKICCICGANCASADRTKDTKGRYFCMPCFTDLLGRKKRGERIVLPPAPSEQSAERAGIGDPLGGSCGADCSGSQGTLAALSLSADSPLIVTSSGAANGSADGASKGVPGLGLDDSMPAAPSCAACPHCAALLAPRAALCLQCGTNLRTGRRLSTTRIRGHDATWPTVLGTIALAVSAGLLALTGVQAYAMISRPIGTLAIVAQGAALLLQAWFGLWHGIGALDTLRRRELGVHRLRLSSAAWLTLLTIGTTGAVTIVATQVEPSPARHARLDSIALGALISAAWPLVVVVWTGRQALLRDVAAWR